MKSQSLLESRITTVQLCAVRKVFGRQLALAEVSCRLLPGELTLLMGPNGAGKSTLLAVLSTLSSPTSGTIYYTDNQTGDHRFAEQHLRHRIGYVSHSPMVYRQLSVRENLLFFAQLYGLAKAPRRVEQWLERMELAPQTNKLAHQLSRGLLQRLALARGFLPDPDLLLLDEPFTGLDDSGTALLVALLQNALAAKRIVVLVSHTPDALAFLCGHLVILQRGRIVNELTQSRLTAPQIQEAYRMGLAHPRKREG